LHTEKHWQQRFLTSNQHHHLCPGSHNDQRAGMLCDETSFGALGPARQGKARAAENLEQPDAEKGAFCAARRQQSWLLDQKLVF